MTGSITNLVMHGFQQERSVVLLEDFSVKYGFSLHSRLRAPHLRDELFVLVGYWGLDLGPVIPANHHRK